VQVQLTKYDTFSVPTKQRHGVITQKTVIFKILHSKNVKFNLRKSRQHHTIIHTDFISVLSEISPSDVTNCPFFFKYNVTNSVKHRRFWGNNSSSLHASHYPALRHHNNYNRTRNHRQYKAVRPPEDGRKYARNMLRIDWLLINHLLHLVRYTFIYLTILPSTATSSRWYIPFRFP
jgi:hypothetical protein